MTVPEQRWRPLARGLAARIAADHTPWHEVFAATPRHVFVPEYWDRSTGEPQRITSASPEWPAGVYADDALATRLQQHPDYPGVWVATSSSTRPSLMLSMLEALDVAPGMRVLEIGTGTGYNTALLAVRLGGEHVVSLDLDPELVEAARRRLATLGLHPTVVTADGMTGWPDGAPYDRVIATHAVERIPQTWVAQTRPGGVILADVRSVANPSIGRIARLTVNADGSATGDFAHPDSGGFMAARHSLHAPTLDFGLHTRDLRDATPRSSPVGGAVLHEPGLAFALWSRVPQITISHADETLVSVPDGSWASAPEQPGKVHIAGPRDLWSEVEAAWEWWHSHGRPDIDRFRLTVIPDGQQRLWVDTPQQPVLPD
ncbi:methyltransferase domain-containing protein [Salinactinospora qingdaonensis]|uniref:Protein-L-isoaspartate O-methyltransferase n=1 Tax=Salinactinospora qingdaonensis TaxID=702744 RepID=A0ABP7F7M7_9ACTN